MFSRLFRFVSVASLVSTLLFSLGSIEVTAAIKDKIVDPSVHVQINERALASGTLIRIKGVPGLHMLTAAHVVDLVMKPEESTFYTNEKGEQVEVPTPAKGFVTVELTDTRKSKANVVWFSKTWDTKGPDLSLCKLEKDLKDVPGAEICQSGECFELGEEVWFCGSGGGLKWSLCKTIVNQFDDRYVYLNGIGWYGHSGSGVYVNRGGKWIVVGVITLLQSTDNPKSPVMAETKLKKFIDNYVFDYNKKVHKVKK